MHRKSFVTKWKEEQMSKPYRECQELIEQAKRERKWIYILDFDIWVTPEELEALQAEGKYRWDVGCFKIRSPEEGLADLETDSMILMERIKTFTQKVEAWRKTLK